jgi:TonB family protein
MRIAACLLVVAGCAKSASKQEAASPPSSDRHHTPADEPVGGAVAPAAPTTDPSSTAPMTQPVPTPTGGGPPGGAPNDQAAKEAARSQGLLGPSDQDSFRPLEQAPKGDGKAKAPRAVQGAVVSVAIGTPVLAAKGDASLVITALGKRQAELDKCYATARGANASLAGSVTVAFTINPDGTLAAVSVSASTVKNAALEKCVVGVVGAAKLDKPLGTSAIKATLPLSFGPQR